MLRLGPGLRGSCIERFGPKCSSGIGSRRSAKPLFKIMTMLWSNFVAVGGRFESAALV